MQHCKQIILLMAGIACTLAALGQQKNPDAENPLNKQSWNESNTTTHQKPRFEPNKGQIADHEGNVLNELEYVYRAPGMKMGLKQNGFVYNLYTVEKEQKPISEATGKPKEQRNQRPNEATQQEVTYHYHRVEVKFLNANEDVKIKAENKTEAYANYYLGHCPEGITNVYGYQKLTYKNLYDNIDLVLTRKQDEEGREQLKYDIMVHPGGDLSEVKMAYKGMEDLSAKDGHLQITTSQGQMTETIPASYWAESEEPVDVNYQVDGNIVRFQAKQKQKGQTLVVDPLLSWSTFLGGIYGESGNAVVTDNSGNVFITGGTESGNFPTTSGAYQTSFGGGGVYGLDAFLSKFSSGGSLSWSTFLGGGDIDIGFEVATDDSGNAFVTGETQSSNFPATSGAYQTSFGGVRDAFLSKFSSGGSLSWSTFLGGGKNDRGKGVAADNNGNVFVTGYTESSNFPTTIGAYQTSHSRARDAFLSKFSSGGSLSWSTFLGGGKNDGGKGVAADNNGNVFVTGYTESTYFPTTSGAYQTSFGGSFRSDAFLSKFSSGGSLSWSTFLGGSDGDQGEGVAIDSNGNAFVTGTTESSNFPTTPGGYQTSYGGSGNFMGGDAFLSKFSSGGSLNWSTFLGGSDDEISQGVATDKSGNAFITGQTESTNFPTTSRAYQVFFSGGDADAFLSKFSSGGSLSWSTFLGDLHGDYSHEVATDGNGSAFITGETESSNFPTNSGAYQDSFGGVDDVFLTSFINCGTVLTADFISDSVCRGNPVQLTDNSSANNGSITKYDWDLGDGNTDTGSTISHVYSNAGSYNVSLMVTDDNGCIDTISKNVEINKSTSDTQNVTTCDRYKVPSGDETYTTGGTYMDTIPNSAGCDSVVTLNLSINNSNSGTDTVTARNSYTWPANGQIYDTSGIYNDTLTNKDGCDSIVYLNLTINCPLQQATFTEGFETTALDETPKCWDSLVDVSFGNPFVLTSDVITPHTGSNYFLLANAGAGYAGDFMALISPKLSDLSSNNNRLRFYAKHRSGVSDYSDQIIIGTMSDKNNKSTFTGVDTFNSTSNYQEYIAYFDNVASNAKYFAIKHGATNYDGRLFIDDITYESIPPCPEPGNLRVTITGPYSATINWTAYQQDTWALEYGEAGFSPGNGTTINTSNSIYTINSLDYKTDYDVYVKEFCANGDTSAYIGPVTFSTNCPITDTIAKNACNTYTWPANGQTYNVSGIYMGIIANNTECDSAIALNLTINNTDSHTDTIIACDSYTWPTNGQTYTNSGIYTDTLTNNSGCDSVVTLNLTINKSNSGADTITACDSYTVPSGDETYTSSGIYFDTLHNGDGCDSILTIHLNLKAIDTSISQTGNQLIANDTMGAYQWLSCDTNGYSKITGATSQTYQVEEDGNYAVTITNGPCTDTSNCHKVTVASLASLNVNSEIDIYPNPTRGTYWVDLNKQHSKVIIQVQNWAGQAIAKRELTNVEEFEGKLKGKAGIYFVNIFTENGKMARKKILKLY